jgi:hypothetical protein
LANGFAAGRNHESRFGSIDCDFPHSEERSRTARCPVGRRRHDPSLSGQTREIFDAVMLLYGSLQLQRADIAHGIFGHIDIDDDTIVPWIEAKKLSKDFIDKFHRPRDPDGPAAGADTRAVQKRETSIYKISDLEQLAKEINELWGIAFSFTSSLRWPGSEHAIKTLEVQCKVPQMQYPKSESVIRLPTPD